MRLLHSSDWHLGAADGERSLLEDQKFFVDAICGIIAQQQIDAVLLAGDVYDRSVASADAIRLFDSAMTRICRDLHTPVLMIAGNHDGAERLSNCSGLLEASGLHICGSAKREPTKIDCGDAEIYLLPWITEEKVKSLFPEEKENIQSIEDAYRVIIDSMRRTFTPGKKHILVSHAFITNAETSTSDRAAVIGFAMQVSASVFAGFDYVALGHIHKPQQVAENIRYSGAPMPYSFGKEETQTKSVTVVDTDTMAQEIIPLPLLHRRTTLSGTYEELLAGRQPEEIRNGYVRLQVTDSYVGPEMISALRNVYPNLLEVQGKSFEAENAVITLSAHELEHLEENPMELFRYFCREEVGEEPGEHLEKLFEEAMQRVEEDAE